MVELRVVSGAGSVSALSGPSLANPKPARLTLRFQSQSVTFTVPIRIASGQRGEATILVGDPTDIESSRLTFFASSETLERFHQVADLYSAAQFSFAHGLGRLELGSNKQFILQTFSSYLRSSAAYKLADSLIQTDSHPCSPVEGKALSALQENRDAYRKDLLEVLKHHKYEFIKAAAASNNQLVMNLAVELISLTQIEMRYCHEALNDLYLSLQDRGMRQLAWDILHRSI